MKTLQIFFDLLFEHTKFKHTLRCQYLNLKAELEVYVLTKKHELYTSTKKSEFTNKNQ